MSDAQIEDKIEMEGGLNSLHSDQVHTGGIALMEEEESPLNSTINTTPLVDIMLVMLIIFLITVPVAVGSIPLQLPVERNRVVLTRPDDVNIWVDERGNTYWNTSKITETELAERLARAAVLHPQPEVHIRGDANTEYVNVGKVVEAAQKAGMSKVGFITKKPIGG
jgi:biopolymer transport protein ExbD